MRRNLVFSGLFISLLACTNAWLSVSSQPVSEVFNSKELNQQGIAEYRQKNYERATNLFKEAIKRAEPNSFDELTANSNLNLVNEVVKDKSPEAWHSKRHEYILRNKLLGDAIPENYAGDTPEKVTESLLEKKISNARTVYENLEAQTNLLHFYQDRHEYPKAKKTYDEIVESLTPGKSQFALPQDWVTFAEDIGLIEIERDWSEYARSEKQEKEAEEQLAKSKKLAADLPKLRKQEEIRQRQQEIEKKRQEAEIRKYKEAEDAYQKQQALVRFQEDEKQAQQQPPDLKGNNFSSVGSAGGFLKFIDESNVDIGTRFQILSPVGGYKENTGEIPEVLAGTYKISGTAPKWEIRIASMLKGSSRIDTYRWSIMNGKQVLSGGQAPFPMAVADPYMSDAEYDRLLAEESGILKEKLKGAEEDLKKKRAKLKKLEGK